MQGINSYFASVFTHENTTSVPAGTAMFQEPPSEALQDITITEEMVEKKLSELREDKAAEADNISPRFLLEECAQICVPLTRLFRQSLSDGVVPED